MNHRIKQQSPNDFTIQVEQSPRPAQVANTLQQLPKSSHNAEARTQSGPDVGPHGSYATRLEAEEAFNKLPPTITI
jgi:septal ring-binding cell division protein DamX